MQLIWIAECLFFLKRSREEIAAVRFSRLCMFRIYAFIPEVMAGLVCSLFCRFKKSAKKIPGKGGLRYWKNVGLGFKTPKEAIEGETTVHIAAGPNCLSFLTLYEARTGT